MPKRFVLKNIYKWNAPFQNDTAMKPVFAVDIQIKEDEY